MGVCEQLPRVVTRQCTGRESNSQSPDHESNALTTTPPSQVVTGRRKRREFTICTGNNVMHPFSLHTCWGWSCLLLAGLGDISLCWFSPCTSDQPRACEQAWRPAVLAFSVYHRHGSSKCRPTSPWIYEDSNTRIYRCEIGVRSRRWEYPRCLLCAEDPPLRGSEEKSCSKYTQQHVNLENLND